MNNLYQGGQCNPNAINATSNQYKRAMNTMMVGSQNPERLIEQAQGGKSYEEEIMKREIMFKNMNQQWADSKFTVGKESHELHNMMNMQYSNAVMQEQHQQNIINAQYTEAMHEEHRRFQLIQQQEWIKAQEHLKMQENMMIKEFQNAKIIEEAEKWKNQLKMGQNFDNAKLTYEEEQKNILDSSSSMLNVMMNDPDPRFQNSQFLHFLKRIQNGELVIEGKELKETKPDEVLMEKSWDMAEKIQQSNMAMMDKSIQEAKQKEREETLKSQMMLQENWQNKLEDYEKQYANQAQFEKMLEQKYMDVLKEMNLDLTQSWQAASDLEEQLVHGEIKSQYIFSPNNPFLDVAFPKKLSLEFINEGKNNEAILALEAHLQKNGQDADSWRILGRILQENDQDQKSVPCFLNCLKQSPENLDCLLSLGVSCTNILDEVKAMNFLKKWIMVNPKYKMQGINHIIPDEYTNQATYKVQEIKEMNNALIKVFDDAVKMNPNDPQLLTALAILFFIKRQYEVSIDLFNRALNLDPTNYLLMNKVGATLAHLGRAEEAIDYYHRALDIRPNYVRVWVNIGIAHAFKNMYDEAARFYLNALSFRPDARHVWSYLHTAFMSLQRYDLISQIQNQNPQQFPQFEVISLNDLPHPEIPYKITTEKHILNKDSNSWLAQFQKK